MFTATLTPHIGSVEICTGTETEILEWFISTTMDMAADMTAVYGTIKRAADHYSGFGRDDAPWGHFAIQREQ